ncbi:hypothetical protein D3C76_1197770 [compost metagenome]
MHTAGEVEAQLHRRGAELAQPVRSGRGQVQGNHVVVTEGLAHHVLGRQLVAQLGQAQQAAAFADGGRLDFDAGLLEGFSGLVQVGLLDLQRRAGATDLDRRIIRIEIGCGIDQADRQHRQDQQIFPQRVLVEHDSARYDAGRLMAPRRC